MTDQSTVRMYANVIVRAPYTYSHGVGATERFFILSPLSPIREIITQRDVTENEYLEYVAFSAYIGKEIHYVICADDYSTRQQAIYQRYAF